MISAGDYEVRTRVEGQNFLDSQCDSVGSAKFRLNMEIGEMNKSNVARFQLVVCDRSSSGQWKREPKRSEGREHFSA
jgi:hypothetical protein